MSDTTEIAQAAAHAVDPVLGQAASSQSGAFVVLVLLCLTGLGGIFIWRNPPKKAGTEPAIQPAQPAQPASLPTCAACADFSSAVSDIKGISAQINGMSKRLDDAQESRRKHYDWVESQISGLNRRIDEQTPRREHDAAVNTFHHAQEETNSLLRSLVDSLANEAAAYHRRSN